MPTTLALLALRIDMDMALFVIIITALLISAASIAIAVIIINIITLAIVGVPNLQTERELYPKIVKLAGISPETVVYDLGCSGGDFLMYAADRGAKKCVGYELAILPYLSASIKAMFRKDGKVNIMQQNFFQADLSEADVIYIYLIPTMLPKIFALLDRLDPGAAVIVKGKPINDRHHVGSILIDEATGYGIYKYLT